METPGRAPSAPSVQILADFGDPGIPRPLAQSAWGVGFSGIFCLKYRGINNSLPTLLWGPVPYYN